MHANGMPASLETAVNALPQPQLRSWGTIAYHPARRALVLILTPPEVPVAASLSEARWGFPLIMRELVYPVNVRSGLAGGAGFAGAGVLTSQLSFGSWAVPLVVGLTALCGGASELFARLRHHARILPLPYEGMDIACAIEHASAVAQHHRGQADYDADLTQGLREILWTESETDPQINGALLPLARLLRAVISRNHAVLGPHRLPVWYPAASTDPTRWPVASPRASETADGLVEALRAEAALDHTSDTSPT